jgi:fluoride exporter
LVVNLAGSFLLGVLVAAAAGEALNEHVLACLGTGSCGALTTYSTFSHETLRLLEDGSQARAAANVAVSLIAGTVAVTVGWSSAPY